LKKDLIIAFFLLLSLLIYVFYRTEKTIVNQLITFLFSAEYFIELQNMVRKFLPLNDKIIYSFPGAAWVFCATLTSKFVFIKFWKYKINLLYAPIIFVTIVEVLQFCKITNGHFDIFDLIFSLIFWVVAAFFFNYRESKQNLINPLNANSVVCAMSYMVVFLSDVRE